MLNYAGTKPRAALAVMMVAAGSFLACTTTTAQVTAAPVPPATVAQPGPADGTSPDLVKAQRTFEAVCGKCHETTVVTTVRHNRQGWEDVMDQMYGLGMTAKDGEARDIVAYLTAKYPDRD